MGKISFGKYTNLYSFNVLNEGEPKPPTTDDNTKNSIIYSQVTQEFYDKELNVLSAIYKSQALSSDKFAIYRISPNNLKMDYLGVIDGVADGVKDYGVASNQQYKYIIQTNPQSDNNISIQTDYLNVHWNKWSIVSLSYDLQNDIYIPDSTVFLFDNNIDMGSISDNLNIVKYNTLSRFGKVMQNKQQYDSGSFSCLFGGFKSVYSIMGTKKIVVNTDSQGIISNAVIAAIKQFVKNIIPSDVFVAKNSVYPISAHFFNNNLIVNIYADNKIELIWVDNNSKTKYQSSICENVDSVSYDLVYKMPPSYQRKIYSDIMFSKELYSQSYIYYKEYEEYFEYIDQWRPINKRFAYYDNDKKLSLWKQFVADQKVKLLKSPKGDMWVVAISDQTSRSVNYNSTSYPTTISFSWQEVIDKDKISIMSW